MSEQNGDIAEYEFEVSEQQAGLRLDAVLTEELKQHAEDVSLSLIPTRSKIAGWVSDGHLTLNYKVVTKVSPSLTVTWDSSKLLWQTRGLIPTICNNLRRAGEAEAKTNEGKLFFI